MKHTLIYLGFAMGTATTLTIVLSIGGSPLAVLTGLLGLFLIAVTYSHLTGEPDDDFQEPAAGPPRDGTAPAAGDDFEDTHQQVVRQHFDEVGRMPPEMRALIEEQDRAIAEAFALPPEPIRPSPAPVVGGTVAPVEPAGDTGAGETRLPPFLCAWGHRWKDLPGRIGQGFLIQECRQCGMHRKNVCALGHSAEGEPYWP